MDEPELALLRTWGADLTEPPAHLEGRIKDELWQAILAEEAAAAGRGARRRSPRRWFDGLLRPAVAAGTAAVLAVGVAISSGGGDGSQRLAQPRGGGVVQAGSGLLDTAATSLFGDATSSTAPRAMQRGRIDLRTFDHDTEHLLTGPALDERSGEVSEQSWEFMQSLTRDPDRLRGAMRSAAAELASEDASDRIAFHLTMRWVVSPHAPTDLRAAMVRSLDGLRGLDNVTTAVDLLGRSGLLIGHLDPQTGLREQYLLRSSDATLIARQSFTTAQLDPACPVGTVVDHALYDDAGRPIDPDDAPWLAWPQVISACAPGAPLVTG